MRSAGGRRALHLGDSDCAQGTAELGRDLLGDLALHGKEVPCRAVPAIGPDMEAGRCVDELGSDAHESPTTKARLWVRKQLRLRERKGL